MRRPARRRRWRLASLAAAQDPTVLACLAEGEADSVAAREGRPAGVAGVELRDREVNALPGFGGQHLDAGAGRAGAACARAEDEAGRVQRPAQEPEHRPDFWRYPGILPRLDGSRL